MKKPKYVSGSAMRGRVASKERRTYNDVTYDSLGECMRAGDHTVLIKAGELTHVLRQVKFRLGPDFWWRADFVCFQFRKTVAGYLWEIWVEEIKFYNKYGVEPKEFRDVRRLWEKYGPFPMLIYKRKGTGWDVERIEGAQNAE